VLTVTQAGNIVVDANQAADVNYSAAAQVQQTFVVNQASQTILFTPLSQPFYYIATGATLTIQATGGGSDSAIVFTVDPKSTMTGSFSTSKVSGAVSTSVLTMPANQSPTSGTIIVDATQPGNTNYLAATQTQMTISVGAPLPTQSITFNNPGTQVAGTPLTLTATATSGFAVTYTASPSSVCTVAAASGVWTATLVNSGMTASACTITAYQPGDNQYFAAATPVAQTFAVNPTGQVPNLSVNLSLSNLTIQTGTVGLTQVTLNSVNNFTGSVAFTCSGAPSGYSCTFNPSTISSFIANSSTGLPGSTTASTELSISGGSASAVQPRGSNPLLPEATLAIALCFLGFKRRSRIQRLLMVLIAVVALGFVAGCGGSSGTTQQKATTSTITITATSGSTVKTATLTLIVN
jgi:hypothetical protein